VTSVCFVAESRRRFVCAGVRRPAVRRLNPPVAQGQGPIRQVPDTLLHEFRYELRIVACFQRNLYPIRISAATRSSSGFLRCVRLTRLAVPKGYLLPSVKIFHNESRYSVDL
jgi:hypothetical protein